MAKPVSDPTPYAEEIANNYDENKKTKLTEALIKYANIHGDREYLKIRVKKLSELLTVLGFDLSSIPSVIMNFNDILHRNREEIFLRYLLWGKLMFSKELTREEFFLNKTSNLMVSSQVLYSRIKFFQERKNNPYVHSKFVLNLSHADFLRDYGISKEQLEEIFPIDKNAILEIFNWEENKELIDNINLELAEKMFSEDFLQLIKENKKGYSR